MKITFKEKNLLLHRENRKKESKSKRLPKQTQITEKEKKTHYETILIACARSVQ